MEKIEKALKRKERSYKLYQLYTSCCKTFGAIVYNIAVKWVNYPNENVY